MTYSRTTWKEQGTTPVSAANMNNIEQGVYECSQRKFFKAQRATNQSIPDETLTYILFTTEVYTTDVITHSNSSNQDQIILNTAGIYLITAKVQLGTSCTNVTTIVNINGTDKYESRDIVFGSTDGIPHANTSYLHAAAANDIVRITAYHNHSGSKNAQAEVNIIKL